MCVRNKQMNEQVIQSNNECLREWTQKGMNKWASNEKLLSKWTNEHNNDNFSKLINGCMNE